MMARCSWRIINTFGELGAQFVHQKQHIVVVLDIFCAVSIYAEILFALFQKLIKYFGRNFSKYAVQYYAQ
jgi:hypothetical protein